MSSSIACPGIVPQIQSDSLRALGVTVSETASGPAGTSAAGRYCAAGVRGRGFGRAFAPAKTPPDVVGKIQKTISEALTEPVTNKRLTDLGDEVIGSSPQILADYMQSEMKRWGPLIKEAQIRVDG